MVIIRIIARGLKDGREQEAIVDLFDYYDETTGFTSMERATGWHAAIMAGFMARKQTPLGAVPVELAVPGQVFVEEFRKRGFRCRDGRNCAIVVCIGSRPHLMRPGAAQ